MHTALHVLIGAVVGAIVSYAFRGKVHKELNVAGAAGDKALGQIIAQAEADFKKAQDSLKSKL